MAEQIRPRGIPAEHLAGIGLVVTKWSDFESDVDMAIHDLCWGDDLALTCLTSQIAGIGRKFDAYLSLADYRGTEEKLLKTLGKVAQDAIGLAEQRNRIAHDTWTGPLYDDETHPARFEISARKRLRFERIEVPPDILAKTILNIEALQKRFKAAHKQASDEALRRVTSKKKRT